MFRVVKFFSTVLFIVTLLPITAYAQIQSDSLLSFQLDSLVIEAVYLKISSGNAPLSLETNSPIIFMNAILVLCF